MTEAEKREKVIRGLGACKPISLFGRDCENCPYYDEEDADDLPFGVCNIQDMLNDALELLKEQEARVMMKEEIVLCTDWVWCEYKSGYQGWYRAEEYDTDYGLFRWEDTTTDIIDDYGFRWRAWTSRPTEQQIRDTPWEDDSDGNVDV